MSHTPQRSSSGSPPRMPRWVKVLIIIFIALVVFVVVLHLMGFGFGRHGGSLQSSSLGDILPRNAYARSSDFARYVSDIEALTIRT